MRDLTEALLSCLPLIIISTSIIILSWKTRNKLESINIGTSGIIIRFNKTGKPRN